MKQNVVLAVLARLAASVVALAGLAAMPALAGDRAAINFLGYSEDGQYFAFEEFGVHDGSGGVYSSVYIIDTEADKWTAGTPFSVDEGGDTEDTPSLAGVRGKALAQAASQLKQYKISAPVDILYLLGEGIGNDNGKVVTFSTPSCCGPGQTQADAFTLVLSLGYAKSENSSCDQASTFGYTLSMLDANGTRELHNDGVKIPASRGCPVDYRMYAVVEPFEGGAGGRVAIISSYPFGFEGPDRRFLAVPIDK